MTTCSRLAIAACLLNLGCSQPLAGTLVRSAPAMLGHSTSISFTIRVSRALLATAHYWTPADINLYRVDLLVFNGTTYVDTGVTQDLPQTGGTIDSKASFSNLDSGKKYRVSVQAWGSPGGATAATQLNINNPTTLDYDFTPAQADLSLQIDTAAVILDEMPFSGTVTLTPANTPAYTASEVAELWIQGGSTPIASETIAYAPVHVTFSGLSLGPTYYVKITAKDSGGAVLTTGQSNTTFFDPAGQDVEQAATLALAFINPTPAVSLTNPLAGEVGVGINEPVVATLTQPMGPTTLNATTMTLTGPGSTVVTGAFSYDAATNTETFQPASLLAMNTLYTAAVTTGAKDFMGTPLAGNDVWTFTTGWTQSQAPVVMSSILLNFVVLAGSTVTNTGATVVTGDLGLAPGTSIVGFAGAPGTLVGGQHVNDATVDQAQTDLTAAMTDAASRAGSPVVESGELGGLTLYPGLYNSASGLAVTTGDLTLDAQGHPNAVWVFQMGWVWLHWSGRHDE